MGTLQRSPDRAFVIPQPLIPWLATVQAQVAGRSPSNPCFIRVIIFSRPVHFYFYLMQKTSALQKSPHDRCFSVAGKVRPGTHPTCSSS